MRRLVPTYDRREVLGVAVGGGLAVAGAALWGADAVGRGWVLVLLGGCCCGALGATDAESAVVLAFNKFLGPLGVLGAAAAVGYATIAEGLNPLAPVALALLSPVFLSAVGVLAAPFLLASAVGGAARSRLEGSRDAD